MYKRQGFDICKRTNGTILYVEKEGKIVGKYNSTRNKHGGLYLVEDHKVDTERSPRFAWDKIEQVLLADLGKHVSCPAETAGDATHLLCTQNCTNKGSGHVWGTSNCFIANSFNMGINTATLHHQRLGHMSLSNPKLKKRLSEALGADFTNSLKSVGHCESCVMAKATNLPYTKQSRSTVSRPLERVWFDVIGPVPVRGQSGFNTS